MIQIGKNTYYVKYRNLIDKEWDTLIYERGSLYPQYGPLSEWSIEDINEDIRDGVIELLDFKELKTKGGN